MSENLQLQNLGLIITLRFVFEIVIMKIIIQNKTE